MGVMDRRRRTWFSWHREWMNSGEIWQSMPTDLQDNVTGVLKRTNNMEYEYEEYSDRAGAVSSATSGRSWIVSNKELASNQSDDWLAQYHGSSALADEGSTYEWFSSKNVKDYQDNTALKDIYRTSSGVGPAGLYLHSTAWLSCLLSPSSLRPHPKGRESALQLRSGLPYELF